MISHREKVQHGSTKLVQINEVQPYESTRLNMVPNIVQHMVQTGHVGHLVCLAVSNQRQSLSEHEGSQWSRNHFWKGSVENPLGGLGSPEGPYYM